MKFIYIVFLFSFATTLFADKPVQSSRAGKFGGIHPNAWRVSQEVDVKGEGKNYIFKVSIYKDNTLCDFFEFKLNKGAKNTKKSTFSLKGDLESENFGSEVSLEFLEEGKDGLVLKIEAKAKLLDEIAYIEGKYRPKFNLMQLDLERTPLAESAPLKLAINEEESTYFNIEVVEE